MSGIMSNEDHESMKEFGEIIEGGFLSAIQVDKLRSFIGREKKKASLTGAEALAEKIKEYSAKPLISAHPVQHMRHSVVFESDIEVALKEYKESIDA